MNFEFFYTLSCPPVNHQRNVDFWSQEEVNLFYLHWKPLVLPTGQTITPLRSLSPSHCSYTDHIMIGAIVARIYYKILTIEKYFQTGCSTIL